MSGTSYTPRNSTPSSTAYNSAAAEACGKIVLGLAAGAILLPAAAAGVAAYGLVKGIGLLSKAGVKAYRRYKEEQAANQARIDEIHRQAAAFVQQSKQQIASAGAEAGITVKQASPAAQESIAALAKTAASQTAELQRFGDTQLAAFKEMREALLSEVQSGKQAEQFSRDISAQSDALFRSWDTQTTQLETAYAGTLRRKQAELSASLRDSYSAMLRQAKNMAETPVAKQQALKSLADTAVSDGAQLLTALSELPGTAAFAARETALLGTAYTRCTRAFAAGHYEEAYSTAEDIVLQAQEITADVLRRQLRAEAMRDRLTARAAMLDESFSGISKVEFVHKGVCYQEDLKRFYPEGFRAAETVMKRFWGMLHSGIPMTDAELRAAEELLDGVEVSYRSVYDGAWKRMIRSYYTEDLGGAIAEAMRTQGYELEGSAFEGGQEGEKLHINFINRVTGKSVTVVVGADVNGTPDVQLEQYGLPGETPDRAKQETLRRIVSETIGVQLTCQAPGQHSHNTEAADLQKQEQRQLNAPS